MIVVGAGYAAFVAAAPARENGAQRVLPLEKVPHALERRHFALLVRQSAEAAATKRAKAENGARRPLPRQGIVSLFNGLGRFEELGKIADLMRLPVRQDAAVTRRIAR